MTSAVLLFLLVRCKWPPPRQHRFQRERWLWELLMEATIVRHQTLAILEAIR
jgi:hypothetical protein